MGKPQAKTIRRVVEYLQENGLAVYGPCVDLETLQGLGGCMDYDADEAIKFIKVQHLIEDPKYD